MRLNVDHTRYICANDAQTMEEEGKRKKLTALRAVSYAPETNIYIEIARIACKNIFGS